ncbi:hypothetical protein E3N88_10178 [Mikania micrantha]|uniref:Uncharacterized protein n=1 Tax=Mikania micrantha TaxID=192012 RepID=A0A5N6PC67_9ASTR|nr:hypothetical protein E3N88_10178 [Mikania micrantha]
MKQKMHMGGETGLQVEKENKSKEAVYESEPEEECEENENDYDTEGNVEDFKFVEVQDATMEKSEFADLQDSSTETEGRDGLVIIIDKDFKEALA